MNRSWLCLSFTALCLLWSESATADGESWEHHARPLVPAVARPQASLQACSRNVCIHTVDGKPRVAAATILAALEHGQTAYDALMLQGLPAPPHDGPLGGGPRFDIYLDGSSDHACAWDDLAHLDGRLDQTSAFGLVGTRQLGPQCALASHVARTVSQAFLLGIDPAMHVGTLAMLSSYQASLIAPCGALETAAIDDFQRQPQLSLQAASRLRFSGNMLFPAFLDSNRGDRASGHAMNALLSLATQTTQRNAERWLNEPDLYDALRRLLKPLKQDLSDVLIDFAIARAFVGDRSDGAHIEDTARHGAMGRVRFEWAVKLASLPRRLAPLAPLAPTGASYLWLDLSGATAKDQLTVVAEWEESFVFKWALVKVDAEGRELTRYIGGGVWGSTKLRMSFSKLDDAAGVIIVATHAGNDDRARPYDPDVGISRRASFEVTLYNQ